MKKHIPTITSFPKDLMFWNSLPQLLIGKEKPSPMHPALLLGWWECQGESLTLLQERYHLQPSWHKHSTPLKSRRWISHSFPRENRLQVAKWEHSNCILQFSVPASLISNFNWFVTSFCNLPSSTLPNIPGPRFVANGFAPTQERTILCCEPGLTTADP